LTFSFASYGYYTVYKQMMRVMGIPRSIIQAHEPILRNLLGFIRGRIYYNINNWYRGLLLLPSFQKNKEDMERMMGLKEPVDFIEDQILSSRERWRRLPRLLFALVRLKWRFAGLRRAVPKFLSDFEARYTSVHRASLQTSSISELMEVLKRLRHNMLENWRTPIVNDFFVMMTNGRLRRWLKRGGFEDADSLQNELMGGEERLDSAEPARQLMRMAQDARRHHGLSAILCAGTTDGVLKKIRTLYPSFACALDDYVEQFGDRCIGELKFETISLREDPTFIIHVLRNYLNHQDLDPGRILIRQKIRRAKAETRVMAKSGLLGRWRFQRVLAKGRDAVRDRESMRLCRSRMFGLFRDIYRALGERLTEAGRLRDPRDIFYLTTEEIEAYCEGRAGSTELASLARIRKTEFAEYQKHDLPDRFETYGPVYHDNSYDHRSAVTTDPCASTLSGVGCCPGIVESEVKIIVSPRHEFSVNGKILVAIRTDPGWAPLFPTVSGMLVERGSTLSHSAVVARELGIPTIVGIPGITQILTDGERVRMDGAQGLVRRMEGMR
jgi:pyruvate,water dikinase